MASASSEDDSPADVQGSAHSAARLAPSDFLPGLPPSTLTPSLTGLGVAEPATDVNDPASSRPRTDDQGRTLNPRSCVTCRRRKVKCDKLQPCTNCNRAHIQCVFPAPGRAPRRSRKVDGGRDKELLARLRRLEGVVKSMGVDVLESETVGALDSRLTDGHTRDDLQEGTCVQKESRVEQDKDEDFATKTQLVDNQQKGRFEAKFGRLVVHEGRSRYIGTSFWANLSHEVEDLKGILNHSSDEEDTPSPGFPTQNPNSHHGFMFGFSSQNVDMLSLHPLPNQITEYWAIYKDRVDPVLKVLHLPTLEPTIISAASHLPNLSRGFECLLFAIYYAATTSLSERDCLAKLGEDKPVLLTRYRFGVEQALARANFLNTEELVVLQALVVFLMTLRRNSGARVIWTLTGLVVRIAQTLGIHRDGTHFGLRPFEIEMRRRLWWQICILDVRASEDHGCDPTIVEQSFDTKLPLNVNDDDLTPSMKEFPPEREGCTDMSFPLLRFEVSNTFRRINYLPPGTTKACERHLQSVTVEDKERWITECHQRLEERYLKHCDMSVPLFWVTATVARMMMSKMWLMVYHPFQRRDGGASLSEEVREKLFITSLENMEYSVLLETEPRTRKWSWLFKSYQQWHAIAFILSELCRRTTGPLVERAWTAVEQTRGTSWSDSTTNDLNTGNLWRPLKKLYRKAQVARQNAMLLDTFKAPDMDAAKTYTPNANPMFEHPTKPAMTRAPLSSAQLQRFSSGPSFGQVPLDKHKLLRSPKGSTLQPVNLTDASNLDIDFFQQTSAFNGTQTTPQGQTSTDVPYTTRNSSRDMTDLPVGTNLFTGTEVTGFDSISADPYPAFDSTQSGNLPQASMVNYDTNFSIMDTSGDMDWDNWDQLIRQFGAELESTTVLPPTATTAGQYWTGPQWDTGGSEANMPGNGMGATGFQNGGFF